MKDILDFLAELRLNNNREWFNANKSRYLAAHAEFNGIVEQLIASIAVFDKDVAPLTVKDCVFRIYRDTRFSPNKTPYKTHMGVYIARGGKNSPYAGYYFHLEPQADSGTVSYLGGSLVACGVHCPEPKVLRSVREDLFARGDLYASALKSAAGFELDTSATLQRTPKGFPAGSKWDDYLKLKEFSAIKHISAANILAPNAIEKCVKDFKKVKPINDLLNNAVEYAFSDNA